MNNAASGGEFTMPPVSGRLNRNSTVNFDYYVHTDNKYKQDDATFEAAIRNYNASANDEILDPTDQTGDFSASGSYESPYSNYSQPDSGWLDLSLFQSLEHNPALSFGGTSAAETAGEPLTSTNNSSTATIREQLYHQLTNHTAEIHSEKVGAQSHDWSAFSALNARNAHLFEKSSSGGKSSSKAKTAPTQNGSRTAHHIKTISGSRGIVLSDAGFGISGIGAVQPSLSTTGGGGGQAAPRKEAERDGRNADWGAVMARLFSAMVSEATRRG